MQDHISLQITIENCQVQYRSYMPIFQILQKDIIIMLIINNINYNI